MDETKGRPISGFSSKVRRVFHAQKVPLTNTQYLDLNNIDKILENAMLELLQNKPDNPFTFLATHFQWLESKNNPLEKACQLLVHVDYNQPAFESHMRYAYTIVNQCKADDEDEQHELRGITGEIYMNFIEMLSSELNDWEQSKLFENMHIFKSDVVGYSAFRTGILCCLHYKHFLHKSKELYKKLDPELKGNNLKKSEAKHLLGKLHTKSTPSKTVEVTEDSHREEGLERRLRRLDSDKGGDFSELEAAENNSSATELPFKTPEHFVRTAQNNRNTNPGPSNVTNHVQKLPSSSSRGTVTPKNTINAYRTPKMMTNSSRKTAGQISCSTTTSRSIKPSVIAAVVEGRGCARGEIGLASIDLKNPQIVLSQFSDSQTYVKTITQLQIMQALEIVMPNTTCESGNISGLFKQISEHFQSTNIVTVQRKYFNESKGLQYIRHLRIPECKAVEMQIATKYYCLATAAALLKYVEFIQNTLYAPNSLKIIFTGSENTTMIDMHTAKNLELIMNLKDAKSEHTLYGVVHNTKTIGGARLLRANLLQPPCDLNTINTRMDCVSEFLQNEELFFMLQSVLSRFLDVDHLLSLCVQIPKQESVKTAENKITNIIYLKHTLELVQPLRNALRNCNSQLHKEYSKSLDDPRYELMLNQILEIIHEDTVYKKGTLNMRAQKCFAIKPNINGLLDVARRIYAEIVDDITEMIQQLSEKFNLPLRTGYSTGRGFYIQLHCGGNKAIGLDQLPPVFIKKNKLKNTLSFTTIDLIKANGKNENNLKKKKKKNAFIFNKTGRVNESLNEIFLMSNVIVSKLLSEIIDNISCLYKLSEVVSTLDMLISFAQTCTLSDYVRPEFTNTLAIKQGRHPILERISPEPPTPNNTYISEETNFIIITGPNMSGKSTYMKQIALMQIMAQAGCFVPAEYASFRLTNHIFSRIGNGDDIETNSSTFMMEMKEVNYILYMKTKSSLIIIDELGRGTSVEEGIGMCYSICEKLLQTKSFTMLTTHFMELTYLDLTYPNVGNYHFQVDHLVGESGKTMRMHFTHTIASGPTDELDYGIKLAELSTLPVSVIENARKLADTIRLQLQANNIESQEAKQRRIVLQLAKRLIQVAKNSTIGLEELNPYLLIMKEQYRQDFVRLSQ